MSAATHLYAKPHFSITGDKLRFLNAPRVLRCLTPEERQIFIAAGAPGGLVRVSLSAPLQAAADALLAAGVLVAASSGYGERRNILVLEPHGDDAVLSLGGTMWTLRNKVNFTVLTLASVSNYTSSFQTRRPYFNRQIVTQLRHAEGDLAMTMLGGRYEALGLQEATLRYADEDWSEAFFAAHRTSVSAFNNRRADDAVLAHWADALEARLEQDCSAELWFPLGAGTHSDHDLTRNAVLTVLRRRPDIMRRYERIMVYRDVPYGHDFPDHTTELLNQLDASRVRLKPAHHAISAHAMAAKYDLLSVFASQFKLPFIKPGVEASAADEATPDGWVEHLWQLGDDPIPDLEMAKLWIGAPKVVQMAQKLAPWCATPEKVRQIAVLALNAPGRWADDLALLRNRFTQAQITVYAAPAALAEIKAGSDAGVTVRSVNQGSMSWGIVALRLALTVPSHILFLAGQREEQARKLARLWPCSDVIITRDMEPVFLALASGSTK